MSRCAKIKFDLPALNWFLFTVFFQCFLDSFFDAQGAPRSMCSAVAEKAFGEFVVRIAFAAFFELCDSSEMPGSVMEFAEFDDLILIFIVLLLKFFLFGVQIISVVA